MELTMDMEYLKEILEKHYNKLIKDISFNEKKLYIRFKKDYTEE